MRACVNAKEPQTLKSQTNFHFSETLILNHPLKLETSAYIRPLLGTAGSSLRRIRTEPWHNCRNSQNADLTRSSRDFAGLHPVFEGKTLTTILAGLRILKNGLRALRRHHFSVVQPVLNDALEQRCSSVGDEKGSGRNNVGALSTRIGSWGTS